MAGVAQSTTCQMDGTWSPRVVCDEDEASYFWIVISNKRQYEEAFRLKSNMFPECTKHDSREAATAQLVGGRGNPYLPVKEITVSCCNPLGTIVSRPGCMSALTWEGAAKHCEGHGLRLCSVGEIANDDTVPEDDPCEFDQMYTWTSSTCEHGGYREPVQILQSSIA